ncbi:hypothetical protein NECAME_18863 [Necator americanus]|uniref:Acid ceramidase N-terminal domain-containing protein n=1 Tax=Necator americanus TaxID=51031 RepID=W2SS22_NECAM|nr:hypothetical protein NECAME_18863 [Necator americanus]ETN72420.1 hypothetical protein NECAME_18863 [Necator americanus]
MNALSFVLLVFISFTYCAKIPKQYVVDLDSAPSERWNEVVRDHLDVIPEFVKAAQ